MADFKERFDPDFVDEWDTAIAPTGQSEMVKTSQVAAGSDNPESVNLADISKKDLLPKDDTNGKTAD